MSWVKHIGIWLWNARQKALTGYSLMSLHLYKIWDKMKFIYSTNYMMQSLLQIISVMCYCRLILAMCVIFMRIWSKCHLPGSDLILSRVSRPFHWSSSLVSHRINCYLQDSLMVKIFGKTIMRKRCRRWKIYRLQRIILYCPHLVLCSMCHIHYSMSRSYRKNTKHTLHTLRKN